MRMGYLTEDDQPKGVEPKMRGCKLKNVYWQAKLKQKWHKTVGCIINRTCAFSLQRQPGDMGPYPCH